VSAIAAERTDALAVFLRRKPLPLAADAPVYPHSTEKDSKKQDMNSTAPMTHKDFKNEGLRTSETHERRQHSRVEIDHPSASVSASAFSQPTSKPVSSTSSRGNDDIEDGNSLALTSYWGHTPTKYEENKTVCAPVALADCEQVRT
jgi:hypothetical protein